MGDELQLWAKRQSCAAILRVRAQALRTMPYESATMAEAAVLAARELQDLADIFEREGE